MTDENKLSRHAVRAAVKIHEHLRGPARQSKAIALPQAAWDELSQATRRMCHVERRGWQSAAGSLVEDIDYLAGRFERELQQLRQDLSLRRDPKLVNSAGEIASELMGLGDEFEEVQIDLKERSVSALTAPIVLENVHLGRFRIVLHWERIGLTPAYELVAEEPNCAEGDDNVPHPHIRDNRLCEGEGTAPIKAALRAGRLYDFFVLVRQILQTYNSSSAYVTLSRWHGGRSCDSCGTSVDDDDGCSCDRCDDDLCGDCSWGCEKCGRNVCTACSAECDECRNRYCLGCFSETETNSKSLCETCLAEAQQTKAPADDTPQPPPSETQEYSPSEPTAATPDGVCLVEVTVHPRPRPNRSRRVRGQQPRQSAARRRRRTRAAAMHASDS